MRYDLFIKSQLARTAVCAAVLLVTCGAQAQPQFSFAAIGDVPYEPVASGHQVYPAPGYERLIAPKFYAARSVRPVSGVQQLVQGNRQPGSDVRHPDTDRPERVIVRFRRALM